MAHDTCCHCPPSSQAEMTAWKLITSGDRPPCASHQAMSPPEPCSQAEMAALELITSGGRPS
eukprot:6723178-Karenia_brevis.AAC.1